jgi:hypothetical protein
LLAGSAPIFGPAYTNKTSNWPKKQQRLPGNDNQPYGNAESLCSLGLDQLFNVCVNATIKDGHALPISLEEDRSARAKMMLEAHEALIKTAPENLPKFKDVIQYLEDELHLSK